MKHRGVIIPLRGPVSCMVSTYHDWALTTVSSPSHVSPHEVIMNNGSFLPFFEGILDEIFREEYLMTVVVEEPKSTRILREIGMPEDLIMFIKNEAITSILALIYGYLPDIHMPILETWNYGISEGWNMIVHVPEDQIV